MPQDSLILWCTGMSGSGKTTITTKVNDILASEGLKTIIIDGDEKRETDNNKLSFSKNDIIKNNLSIASKCETIRQNYDVIFVSVITPYSDTRELIREKLSPKCKIIYMNASINTLINRDTKGLYKQAKLGIIDNLIGFSSSSPYEQPVAPDLELRTDNENELSENVRIFYKFIKRHFE